ncbi:MAG: hypothetical protein Q9219_000094 [cf. Caloplaca sp. 3 TL-2023]
MNQESVDGSAATTDALATPSIRTAWCCVMPQFSAGGRIASARPPTTTEQSDHVYTAPLPPSKGFEDPDFQSDPGSNPSEVLEKALQNDCDPMLYWLLFGSRCGPSSTSPRNLCNVCLETKGWKAMCRACQEPICLAHDLRGLQTRVCGYRDLTVEDAVIKEQMLQDAQGALKRRRAQIELMNRIKIHLEEHGKVDAQLEYRLALTTELPAGHDDDLRELHDRGTAQLLWPSTSEAGTPTNAFAALPFQPPAFNKSNGPLNTDNTWRGCSSFVCPESRQIGDHRRPCPASMKKCTECRLAEAFPGFSGCAEDVKPLSPNPFLAKPHDHQSKMPSWAQTRQPRVRDENDVSIATETHSSPAKLGSKSTRFGGINNPRTRKGPQPHMYKPAPGLVQSVASSSSASEAKPMAINAQGSLTSMPNGSTQPTLNLPHGTNLTELFSGVVRQPPPLTTQQVRPRASRFASTGKTQTAVEPKAEEIPVPVDERHLLQSIAILQGRVEELEKIKADLEATNTVLDQKNCGLELEKQKSTTRRRSDSAVSIPDDASNDSKGPSAAHHRLLTEKNRLESACWALQGQKDLLLRDVDTAEAAVEKITQELQQSQAQLLAAQSNIEQLRSEKATIRQQHSQAVAQLSVANANLETLAQEKLDLVSENDKLKAQIARLMQSLPAEENSTSEQSLFDHAGSDILDEEPLDMDTISMMNQQKRKEERGKQQIEQKTQAHSDSVSLESSHNITYLSYAGDSSVCKVRKTLEQERKARQQRRHAGTAECQSLDRADEAKDVNSKKPVEQARQISESSVIKRPKRPSIPQDELTSGFILPDITFNLQPTVDTQAALPVVSQPRLEVSQHGRTQRSVEQPDLLDPAATETREQPVQQPTEPSKLPTVSDEELDITIYDEEPSVRPSQPPDVALAVVMESLQDELVSQRAQLAKYQHSYDRQDVAISRRQRKQLLGKIHALLESCDLKADQIYNLHDVIEGHKQHGQPITQNQVDDTLQSLGLDMPWEGIESTNATRRRSTASSRSI